MESFKELGLSRGMLEVIDELGFSEPTEIQVKSIPLVLEGKDVIGESATGSGKTLAFGSGIVQKVRKNEGVQSLILAPTRELAEQVSQSLKKLASHFEVRITEVYGGVAINPQIREIGKSEIVVGTPGRILDHVNRRTLNLSKIQWLVLDEADRMVDMGFLPDVEKIINLTPKSRQTLLFSATMTPDIEYIEKKYMKNAITVSAVSRVDPSKLKQVYYDVQTHEKFSLLTHFLKNEKSHLVMVFCNTRRTADSVAKNLKSFGVHALAIHGGLTQTKRNEVMNFFHSADVAVLVCTDVAARGLDIKNVSHIYNYDLPDDRTSYVHRIGRTARAGKEGEAISLVSSYDYDSFRKIKEDDTLNIEFKDTPDFQKLRPNFERNDQRSRDRRGFGNRSSPRRNQGPRRHSSGPKRHSSPRNSGPRSQGRHSSPRRHSDPRKHSGPRPQRKSHGRR